MAYTSEDKQKLIACVSCYMLGTLDTGADYYPTAGEEQAPVTIMKNSDNIIYYIRPLSLEPDPIKNILDKELSIEPYIGVDSHQITNQSLYPPSYTMSNNEAQKKKMLMDKFENKLILFKPKIKITLKENRELTYKNLEIIAIEPDVEINRYTFFIPIPRFFMDNKEFEKKLENKTSLVFEEYHQVMPDPLYVLCNNYLYFGFTKWTKAGNNRRAWMCGDDISIIKRLKIDTDNPQIINKMVMGGSNNLLFMEGKFLKAIIEGEHETIGDEIKGESVNEENTEVSSESAQIEDEPIVSNTSLEYEFLNSFKQLTVKNQLCYEMKDLVNFHVCVKTNPITILAGMSGTGKTQLALSYAKMLDLSESEETLLFLPISPSYTEPGDLLGYLNNTNGLFIPSETGFTDFLIHAHNNPEKMHMVIFDEMNLSQIEYWFAPFISLLEKKQEDRTLRLYSKKANCINNERYQSEVNIRDNIIFIGTVNLDETTKDFSDRLLDRANIVYLNKQTFVMLEKEQGEEKENKSYKFDISIYQSWKDTTAKTIFTNEELEFFDKLHTIINSFDSQKGVSFRIVRKIGEYLTNIPLNKEYVPMITRGEALDIEIKQRLITKIKGTEKQFEKLIGVIRDNNSIPEDSILYKFFNSEEIQQLSSFENTINEIIKKAKELGIYGYAS